MNSALNAVLILSCFSVSIASANVTTIFQLESSALEEGFGSSGFWRVVMTGGARGFPVKRGNIGISNVWAGQPCCDSWNHDGWTKLNQEEALQQNPLLEVHAFTSAESRPVTKSSSEYKQDSDGAWRGTLDLDSRVRLKFVPPESGRAALAIYLCEFEETRDNHCVSVVLTGSSSNGKTLRYQTKRPSTYGSETAGSQGIAPDTREYVVSEEYHVREGWQVNTSYYFRIERTVQGDLQVELENGDSNQRHEMAVRGDITYNKITVLLLPTLSDTVRELNLTDDTSWQGNISPGDYITMSFSPNSDTIGHLGFVLCEDQFRDDCSAIVIDGINADKLVRNDPAFWIAGSGETHKPIPDLSKNARWGISSLRFMLTREYNGTVIITVNGEVTDTWHVPPDKQYLIVDSYHNEGIVSVHNQSNNVTASVWRLDNDEGELRSPALPKRFADEDVCISIAARVSPAAEIAVFVQQFGGYKNSIMLETLKSEIGIQWIQKRITFPSSPILRENKVQIVLTARQPAQTKYPVLVQWAASCDPAHGSSNEVSVKEFVSSSPFNDTVGFRSNKRNDDLIGGIIFPPVSHKVCQNDGLLHIDGKCLCRPGFTGRLCERACGPNRYGVDCEGRCSIEGSPRECRGMWLCAADLPCDCAPGLKGPQCDRPCERGEYGVGCQQKCGQCAYGDICDPYSGVCRKGCEGPRLPPFCKTECGRSETVIGLTGDGGLARQVEFPWHVGIYDKTFTWDRINDKKRTIEQICGGTLVSPNLVVSAAHCFWNGRSEALNPPEKYSVGFAKTKRNWNGKEEFPHRVQKRDVFTIHVPLEFQGYSVSTKYDIALVVLQVPIERTPFVVPACFVQVGGYDENLRAGSVARFPGWGRTQKNIPNDDLNEGKMSYIAQEDCLRISPVSFWPYVTEDRFCAGEQGVAYITRGDSGGGLVFQQSGSWFLRGVASAAPPNEKNFAAYTNTSYYRAWIVDWIQSADLRHALIEAFFSAH